MKVKDLISLLEDLDADLEVILQKDGVGTGFAPLATLEPAMWVEEDLEVVFEDEASEGYEENALILGPAE